MGGEKKNEGAVAIGMLAGLSALGAALGFFLWSAPAWLNPFAGMLLAAALPWAGAMVLARRRRRKELGPVVLYLKILAEMVRGSPSLRWALPAEVLIVAVSRGAAALGAALFAAAIAELHGKGAEGAEGAEMLSALGLSVAGAYGIAKFSDWALMMAQKAIGVTRNTAASAFCDQALLAMLRIPAGKSPLGDSAAAAHLLNKKAEARGFVGLMFFHLLPPFMETAIAIGVLLFLGMPSLALGLLAAVAAFAVSAAMLGPKAVEMFRAGAKASGEVSSLSIQAFDKAPLAKVFGSESALGEMLGRRSRLESEEYRIMCRAMDIALALQTIPLALGGIALFVWSFSQAKAGMIGASDFVILNTLVFAVFARLRDISYAFDGIAQNTAALAPHLEVLRAARDLPMETPKPSGPLAPENLSVRGLRVSYGDKEILRGVSLELPAGSKMYLAGRSGAGKTTLIKALLGLIAREGEIIFGESQLGEGSAAFGWVPQETEALSGSARDNLRLGKPDATDEEMLLALEAARLREKIEAIGGLEAIIDRHGGNLSGGERQRLSIARALLSGRPILLLDEPTSGLDALAEKAILAEISGLPCSAILCAHRVRSIPPGSMVACMADGKIVQAGKLEDLAREEGLFRELWKSADASEEA